MKLLFANDKKIIIRLDDTDLAQTASERIETMTIESEGILFKTRAKKIIKDKNKYHVVERQRKKVLDYRDFLTLNNALAQVFYHKCCPNDKENKSKD